MPALCLLIAAFIAKEGLANVSDWRFHIEGSSLSPKQRGRTLNRTSPVCCTGCTFPRTNEPIDYLQLVSSSSQKRCPDCVSLPLDEIPGLRGPGWLMTIYHIEYLMNKSCHSPLQRPSSSLCLPAGGAGQPSAAREERPADPHGGGSGGLE